MTSRGVVMPTGPTASAVANGSDITVAWPAVTLPTGGAVQGYVVTRYTSGGSPVTPSASCQGIITALSCIEVNVSSGTWAYSVQAVQGTWNGPQGARSNAVTVSVADTTPPVVTLGALVKSQGGDGNAIRQGGSYYVYANAADVGSPQSGVASVTANVSAITTGLTAIQLTSGSFTVNGVSYGYRSALLTASNPVSAGSKTISFIATDGAGNTSSAVNVSVVVDNTSPLGADIQTINGGVVGKADTGDRVIYTFSEPIDANSILPGWTGASTTVTVRLVSQGGGDRITVFDPSNTTETSLGFVRLSSSNYVSGTVNFTNSTIVRSGSTITVTLGTASGPTLTVTAAGNMRWTPSTAAEDWAGNLMSNANVTESGALDIDL